MGAKSNLLLKSQELAAQFLSSNSFEQLCFQIVNLTYTLCPYHRAALFEIGEKVTFKAISGKDEVDTYSELVRQWEDFFNNQDELDAPRLISEKTLEGEHLELWQGFNKQNNISGFWLPITVWGEVRFALWIERLGQFEFSQEDKAILEVNGISCRAAFERLLPQTAYTKFVRDLKQRKVRFGWVTAAVLFLALFLIRFPLRVVAPCEIVPEDPYVVTAPLAGVIEKIEIDSGEMVEEGALLLSYDPRLVHEELNIAKQQVKILETTIQNSRIRAFDNEKAKSEIEVLRYKLQQELFRMELARDRYSKLKVYADIAGEAVIDYPDEWRGKPVEIGERIMMLIQPHQNYARVWIPEADNIEFSETRKVKITLNAMPEKTFAADLDYVSKSVTLSPEGVPCVVSEARLAGESQNTLRAGLKGTAILYGENVSIIYWLVRKPWGQLRQFFGI